MSSVLMGNCNEDYLPPDTSQCEFDYDDCYLKFSPCAANASINTGDIHCNYRYSDASAAWILMSAIIVFFMKAGFLLIELAFAQTIREKRHVVTLKHLDVFASAFGFFLIGFDGISRYMPPIDVELKFDKITDPILWFFKFTFASNAATILGGCLVTNMYKLRLPAAFLSAFMISGVIHPLIAQLIWSDADWTFSAYRFCETDICNDTMSSFRDRMYILDFAGGGAVHLVGGMAGLVLCLFAKLQKYLATRTKDQLTATESAGDRPVLREEPDTLPKQDFWEWMYPVDGGGETTNEAALGVLILWFSWFAFNCGSTESVEALKKFSFHAVPSIIAVNMILSASAGGILAVLIAAWAQIRSNSDSVNANEIANGILSALVAITAGCPFYDYWAACIVGVIGVIVYHLGCWLEYKLGIEDTARVVPVHGLCGLWSLLAVGFLVIGKQSRCKLHITFEGLCYCYLRLPQLTYWERLGAQVIGGCLMIAITCAISVIIYGSLFLLPMRTQLTPRNKFAIRYNSSMSWIFKVVFSKEVINLQGSWLFTGPEEIPHSTQLHPALGPEGASRLRPPRTSRDYGATAITNIHAAAPQPPSITQDDIIHTPPVRNTVYSDPVSTEVSSKRRKHHKSKGSIDNDDDGFATALENS